MSGITIAWSLITGACLTLAAVYLPPRPIRRASLATVLFSLSAVSLAAFALIELWMMKAKTPEEYGLAVRWLHVPAAVIIASLVLFVRIRFRAGRWSLLTMILALRGLTLLANFLSAVNIHFHRIDRLERIPFLGDLAAVPVGEPNLWMLADQSSLYLLVLFALDASVTVWRRGESRLVCLTCASVLFFAIPTALISTLVAWGLVVWPCTISPCFLGILLMMGAEIRHAATRLVRLTADLRDSEDRLALATDAAGIGVWTWEIRTGLVSGTDYWTRLFGFPGGAPVTHEAIIDRVHPDDRSTLERDLRAALVTGVVYSGEFRIRMPDRTERWMFARGRVTRGGDGKVLRMVGTTHDITDRRRWEREAQGLREQLAHASRVGVLGELAGSLAHELNQPLTAILSNAQAAQRFLAPGADDIEEVREILADIVSEDKRAGEIIRRLRRLFERGEVERRPLDANDAVEDVLKLTHSEHLERGLVVSIDLASDLPRVLGDRVQIQQVLLNLVRNACEAMENMPRGTRQILVQSRRAGPDVVRFSVVDRGEGIPPDRLEQVFAPFFTTKPAGLGLGLTVCRSIVAAHCGRLWAANNPEGGAAFHVELPAAGEGEGPITEEGTSR